MNFLNIDEHLILRFYFFNISCFLRVLCYFQHVKKIGVKNSKKLSHFISCFVIFNIKNLFFWEILKSAPSLTG